MYYVKRTFHAVGQGAFFTEEFYNDKGLNCCVMYDCGSNTEGQPQKAIDDFMQNHLHVDVLFISHFDKDHISGIKSLIDAKAIDEKTYVVIPFKYPKLLIVINRSIKNLIYSLNRSEANLIGISQISGDNDNIRQERTVEINKKIKIINIGDKITLSGLSSWYYVPFMTYDRNNGQGLSKFEEEIAKLGFNIEELSDPVFVNEHLPEIKEIYKHIPKINTSRTSSINMNSLLVLSYPSEANAVESKYNWDLYRFHFLGEIPYHYLNRYNPASCLYTGDTGFDDINVFDVIMDSVHEFCKCPLGLLQIPHHGSINNYHQDIALRHDEDYIIAFTNYDPKKKVFSNFVKHDLWFHGVPFITITDDPHTSFAQLIRVDKKNDSES